MPSPGIQRRWLTQNEAAERIGVTDRTIRNYIASGQIAGYRLGRRAVRIDADELESLMRRIPTTGGAA